MTLCSSALIRPGWPLPTSDSMWVESLVSAWTTHTLKSLSLSRTSGGIASLLRSQRRPARAIFLFCFLSSLLFLPPDPCLFPVVLQEPRGRKIRERAEELRAARGLQAERKRPARIRRASASGFADARAQGQAVPASGGPLVALPHQVAISAADGFIRRLEVLDETPAASGARPRVACIERVAPTRHLLVRGEELVEAERAPSKQR